MYKCLECGALIDTKNPKFSAENKCPKCRARILTKEVPRFKRTIKAE